MVLRVHCKNSLHAATPRHCTETKPAPSWSIPRAGPCLLPTDTAAATRTAVVPAVTIMSLALSAVAVLSGVYAAVVPVAAAAAAAAPGPVRATNAAAAAACNASSFAVKNDTQGFGLTEAPLPQSLAACVASCCAFSGCATWSWSDADAQCWTGTASGTGPSSQWTTGTRSIPPPTPPAYQLPRLTPFPAPGGAGGPDVRTVDLAGQWAFNPAPGAPDANWTTIAVPGEYAMQGFRIPTNSAVTYQRNLTFPAAWLQQPGLRVKLRCDGVYSDAHVAVNGQPAGDHLGGFTAFELDVTELLTEPAASGANTLTVAVAGSSLADTLASGSKYASHDLGGITRNIYLVATNEVAIADVFARTSSVTAAAAARGSGGSGGSGGAGWELAVDVTLANDGGAAAAPGNLTVSLMAPGGSHMLAAGELYFDEPLAAGATLTAGVVLAVPAGVVDAWDAEHPALYPLFVNASSHSVVASVGFREVTPSGNQLLVNGAPIKVRGSTRHETHPLYGRSLAASRTVDLWREDLLRFQAMNVNWIRTSHYPPAREFLQAADELGMFVELEMPFCWATGNVGQEALDYTVQAQLEAVVLYRSHPSVVAWSLGNESPWTDNFAESLRDYVRKADGTRPFMFDGGHGADDVVNVLTLHYPGLQFNPVPFTQTYAHLNCYNRREILTDPGLRDVWGEGMAAMWNKMYATDGVLGGCFWAGLDDQFVMPSGELVGYGEWGLFDNWRRDKPETLLVRNAYSPVQLRSGLRAGNGTVVVENRHDFTDLQELTFNWTLLASPAPGPSGTAAATASVPPRSSGQIKLTGLPAKLPAGAVLELNAVRPALRARDVAVINTWHLLADDDVATAAAAATMHGSSRVALGAAPSAEVLPDGSIEVTAGAVVWVVNGTTGMLQATSAAGVVVEAGPTLMVLPLDDTGGTQLVEGQPPIEPFTDPLRNWSLAAKPAHSAAPATVVVNTSGTYAGQADAAFGFEFDIDGGVAVSFSAKWTAAKVQPRQIGVVVGVPAQMDVLSWQRTTQFSYYPADHIGRPTATGVKASPCTARAPGTAPTGAWSADCTPLGSADFRATRHNISSYSLSDGRRQLQLSRPDHSQHARVWVDAARGGQVQLLAATYSNEGANTFEATRVIPRISVAPGDVVSGAVSLRVVG